MTPHDQTSDNKSHAIFVRTIAVCLMIVILITVTSAVVWRVFSKPSARTTSRTASRPVELREDLWELFKARRVAEQGDFETALQHADNAAAIMLKSTGSSADSNRSNPSDHIAVSLLQSELLFRLHRTDEMVSPLETVLKLDPDHFEAHANLAFALRFCGMLDEADQHVQWCLERQPDFLPVRRIQAEILRDRGDAESALRSVRDLLLAAPRDLDCHLLQAELLMYGREFELAYQNLLPLNDQFRPDHRFASAMAQLCRVTGRTDKAAEYDAVFDQRR
jgi:tetratricopeptide (TPR) repeat protein